MRQQRDSLACADHCSVRNLHAGIDDDSSQPAICTHAGAWQHDSLVQGAAVLNKYVARQHAVSHLGAMHDDASTEQPPREGRYGRGLAGVASIRGLGGGGRRRRYGRGGRPHRGARGGRRRIPRPTELDVHDATRLALAQLEALLHGGEAAVLEAVRQKKTTVDIGGTLGTREAGEWVAEKVASR